MAAPAAAPILPHMGEPHRLGREGESLAVAHLRAAGWRIVARNYRHGRREIDIIARRGDEVAFVEVKTRSRGDRGHPLEAIDWRKRREILQVARAWIARHGRPRDRYRFDAVAVHARGGARTVQHVEDAWRL